MRKLLLVLTMCVAIIIMFGCESDKENPTKNYNDMKYTGTYYLEQYGYLATFIDPEQQKLAFKISGDQTFDLHMDKKYTLKITLNSITKNPGFIESVEEEK